MIEKDGQKRKSESLIIQNEVHGKHGWNLRQILYEGFPHAGSSGKGMKLPCGWSPNKRPPGPRSGTGIEFDRLGKTRMHVLTKLQQLRLSDRLPRLQETPDAFTREVVAPERHCLEEMEHSLGVHCQSPGYRTAAPESSPTIARRSPYRRHRSWPSPTPSISGKMGVGGHPNRLFAPPPPGACPFFSPASGIFTQSASTSNKKRPSAGGGSGGFV
ncbi:MAG: hypothetical protein PWP23_3344 [Candidatus Sumerlaeota bacterium]|nr:hypothetical protein [Candidatus Sumerlaeota bacterium]